MLLRNMKVVSIGTDRKIFDPESFVAQRQVEYGKIFDELHLIIFSTKKTKFAQHQLSSNVFAHPTNSRSKLLYIFDAFKIAKKIIMNNGNDFTVTTQDPFELGFVGLLLKLRYKLPLHIQIHTDFANKYFIFHSTLNFFRFLISHLTLAFADSIRVVSKRIAKHVHVDHQYLSVLPIKISRELRVKPYGEENKRKIIFLTVARLEKEKDLETAIEAFRKVSEQNIEAEFIIVGDGSRKSDLESKVKSLGLEDKVKFAGWHNDLRQFYKEADIYISTSLYEGYGMSTIEAALHGLSLIISDTGVAGEIFFNDQEALICRQKDVDGFGVAMIKLAKDFELRKKIGERAKETAQRSLVGEEEYLVKYKESLSRAQKHFREAGGVLRKNILFRYLISGSLGAGTQIGSIYLLTDILGVWYIYSSIFSFLIAIIISFLLQKIWTFGDSGFIGAHYQFARYLFVALVGIFINTCLMYLLVDFAGLWYILAQVIVGGVIAIVNFLFYKFFVFNK